MTERLDEHEEQLYRRIVLGELDPASTEARERMAASPALARAVDEWTQVQDRLEGVRREDEELIESSRGAIRSDDRLLVASALRPVSRSSTRSRPVWLWPVTAAAAALLLAIFMNRDDDAGETGVLGSGGCVRPVGEVEEFSPFVIDHELASTSWVEFAIEDGDGVVLVESERLETTTWELSSNELRLLEGVDHILWSYDVIDLHGDVEESGTCESSRAP